MADKFSGSKNGFSNRTIVDLLEKPIQTKLIEDFDGVMGGFVATMFDPARKSTNVTLSNNNLTASGIGNSYNTRTVLDGVSSGKYYWEVTIDSSGNTVIGVYSEDSITSGDVPTLFCGSAEESLCYAFDGTKYIYTTTQVDYGTAYGSTFTANDIIGIALDCDSGKINFSKNGVWQGELTLTAGKVYFPGISAFNNTGIVATANFGQSDFTYSVPSGFTAGFGEGDEGEKITTTVNSSTSTSNINITGSLANIVTMTGMSYTWPVAKSINTMSSGKWYWEVYINSGVHMVGIGDSNSAVNVADAHGTALISWYGSALYRGTLVSGTIPEFTTDDVIGLAYDAATQEIKYSLNGVYKFTAKYSGSIIGEATALISIVGDTYQATFRPNSSEQTYSPPAGYTAGIGVGYTPGWQSTDSDNINLSGIGIISKARTKSNIPWGGSLKCLISFDHKTTWNYWSGTEWVDASGLDYANALSLNDTLAALEEYRVQAGDTYLDFAIKGTSGDVYDPVINKIEIEYR